MTVLQPPWRSLPPTDKQVQFIRSQQEKRGVSVPTTRGECADLIGQVIAMRQEADLVESQKSYNAEKLFFLPHPRGDIAGWMHDQMLDRFLDDGMMEECP